MLEAQYRTCVWCYSNLGERRRGRYCCPGCKEASESASLCEYCGEPAQARDHVVPRAYRYMMEGSRELEILLARMPDTVPSCHQCNSIAGAQLFPSLDAKREHIQERLRAKYHRVLQMRKWDDEELEELEGRLLQSMAAAEAQRRIMFCRVTWPGNAESGEG